MVGLLGFALTTSMLFARVSRPSANIAYSRHAIMAPYREGRGLMFRIANRRGNELIEVNVTVTLSLVEGEGASRRRRFYQLPLERTTVTFFPLSWTVVHPVDPRSPLHGLGREELLAADGELLVLLTATDETFSQSVHSRSSYKGEEIVWGARFRDMFHTSPDGRISVDLQHIHDIEPAPLP
jgi:inward rectifier potassium channel